MKQGKLYIDLKLRIWRIQICQKEKNIFSLTLYGFRDDAPHIFHVNNLLIPNQSSKFNSAPLPNSDFASISMSMLKSLAESQKGISAT